MDEKKRLDESSSWYLNEQLDFDRRMVLFRYRSTRPWYRGPSGLELGPAEGIMTRELLEDFSDLTIVDAAGELLRRIPDHPRLHKVHGLFEEYEPGRLFDTIILEHILEHVEDPAGLLRRVARWSTPRGRLVLGVPNALSFHRLAAVKMGLLKDPTELNPRDRRLGHRRVYTPDAFRGQVEGAGLHVVHEGGVFFKPVSNAQIQEHWDQQMIEAFYLLGHDYPRNAAEIFIVCEVRETT